MPKKDTNESFDLKNRTKYLRIGNYINYKTKIDFKCICGNIWKVSPEKIQAGKGCPKCSKFVKRHTDEVFDNLNTTKYKRVESYVTGDTLIGFLCPDCNNIFNTRPRTILAGSGCPSCASVGFNPLVKGNLYFVVIYLNGDSFLKVGITNRELTERFKEFKVDKVHILETYYGDGYIIQDIERIVHSKITHYKPASIFSGSTECFPLSSLEEVYSVIESEISRL